MGTSRPRDRREQILKEAGTLFRDRGYQNVSMGDVAAAVGVGPSSLYRHFRNKSDLLRSVVEAGLASLTLTVTSADDLKSLLMDLSATVFGRQGLPLLWQREARHLPQEARDDIGLRLQATTSRIADQIRAERPDLHATDALLLAWAILAVFGSVSSHPTTIAPRRLEGLLFTLATRVAHAPIQQSHEQQTDPVSGHAHRASPLPAMPRREALLSAAIALFDERGYRSVNIDDIGEAIGTTGPNIYNYFETKADILAAAVIRGNERRVHSIVQVAGSGSGPEETLDGLVRAYIDFALENSLLVGLLTNELDELPPRVRKDYLQSYRDFIELWTQVLGELRPGTNTADLHVTVYAALTVIEYLVRTGQTRKRVDIAEQLITISHALLLGP